MNEILEGEKNFQESLRASPPARSYKFPKGSQRGVFIPHTYLVKKILKGFSMN